MKMSCRGRAEGWYVGKGEEYAIDRVFEGKCIGTCCD